MALAELSAIYTREVDAQPSTTTKSSATSLLRLADRFTKITRFDPEGNTRTETVGLKGLKVLHPEKDSKQFVTLWTEVKDNRRLLKIEDKQNQQTSFWDLETGNFDKIEFFHPEQHFLYRSANEIPFIAEEGVTGIEQAIVHEDGICSYWDLRTHAFLGAKVDRTSLNANSVGSFAKISEVEGWSGMEFRVDHENGVTTFWSQDNGSFLSANSTARRLCQLEPGYSIPVWG